MREFGVIEAIHISKGQSNDFGGRVFRYASPRFIYTSFKNEQL